MEDNTVIINFTDDEVLKISQLKFIFDEHDNEKLFKILINKVPEIHEDYKQLLAEHNHLKKRISSVANDLMNRYGNPKLDQGGNSES